MPRILLLADNRESILELTELLKDQYEIVMAEEIEKVAGLVQEVLPDLIVADLSVPGSFVTPTGAETVPVLFVIRNRESEAPGVFVIGGADYIAKPFIEREVIARIRLQLELSQTKQSLRECADNLEEKNYQLRDAFEQMENMARIDILTDLPNKAYMVERMQDEVARTFRKQRPLAVIIGDVDNFRVVCDSYGAETANYVLQKMADLIKNKRRGQDVVARWGEDKFMLMLPETYLSDAGRVAERIRNQIEGWEFGSAGNSFRVTVTMGVAEFDAEWGLEGTIRLAENAVKQGKKLNKNCVVLSSK